MKTRNFNHPALDEVVSLGLPQPERAVINNGLAAAAQKLRELNDFGDIDMIVSDENIDYLASLGWMSGRGVVALEDDRRPVYGRFALSPDHRFDIHTMDYSRRKFNEEGDGKMDLDFHIARSEQDERTGLLIASVGLIALKKADSPRPRDIRDMARIAQLNELGY